MRAGMMLLVACEHALASAQCLQGRRGVDCVWACTCQLWVPSACKHVGVLVTCEHALASEGQRCRQRGFNDVPRWLPMNHVTASSSWRKTEEEEQEEEEEKEE